MTAEIKETVRQWIIDFSDSSDPWIIAVPFSWISQILTRCFELQLLYTHDKEKPDQPNSVDREEEMIKYLTQFFGYYDTRRIISYCNINKLEKCIECLLDMEEETVKKNSEDSRELNGDADSTSASKEILYVWNILENYLESENSADLAIEVLQKAENNLSLVLRYIGKILTADPQLGVQYCIQLYPSIRPWNVGKYLSPISGRRRQPGSCDDLITLTHDHKGSCYLEYLTHIINGHEECNKDEELVQEWFEVALRQGIESKDHKSGEKIVWQKDWFWDAKGKPLRGASAATKWKYEDRVLKPVISDGDHNFYCYNPYKIKELCKRYLYSHSSALSE